MNKPSVYVLLLLISLAGCESTPTPFETGEEVYPPMGCIEGRDRGVDC